MSDAIAGFKGKLFASTSTSGTVSSVAEIRTWSISGEMSAIDVTSKDSSGQMEFIAGLKSWTASAEHLYAGDSSLQKSLFSMLTNGTKHNLEFYPQGTSSQFPIYTGAAFITSWELTDPDDDAAAVNVEWQGTGALSASTSS